MQWLMLQQQNPEDFVISSGETHSVREFVEVAARVVGMNIEWSGKGLKEIGVDVNTGKTIVSVDKRYFRPTEVDCLLGDARKAKEKLGWQTRISFIDLVKEMMEHDLNQVKKEELCKINGY